MRRQAGRLHTWHLYWLDVPMALVTATEGFQEGQHCFRFPRGQVFYQQSGASLILLSQTQKRYFAGHWLPMALRSHRIDES
jgi:hypothetical protein